MRSQHNGGGTLMDVSFKVNHLGTINPSDLPVVFAQRQPEEKALPPLEHPPRGRGILRRRDAPGAGVLTRFCSLRSPFATCVPTQKTFLARRDSISPDATCVPTQKTFLARAKRALNLRPDGGLEADLSRTRPQEGSQRPIRRARLRSQNDENCSFSSAMVTATHGPSLSMRNPCSVPGLISCRSPGPKWLPESSV